MPATDFETRLGQAMKALVPDEAEFSGPATSQTATPIDTLAAARTRRRARSAVLVVSGLGVAAAAAAVLLAVGGTGGGHAALPAGQSPTVRPSAAPTIACGAGLAPSSTPLVLPRSAGLPTGTPHGHGRIGSITVTLRNTAAACTLGRQPLVSIDSKPSGLFHLPVHASKVMARPVVVPGGGEVRYRIGFRRAGSHPGEPANVVVRVGSAPARTTPFVRRTNTFSVTPIALVYLGVRR